MTPIMMSNPLSLCCELSSEVNKQRWQLFSLSSITKAHVLNVIKSQHRDEQIEMRMGNEVKKFYVTFHSLLEIFLF